MVPRADTGSPSSSTPYPASLEPGTYVGPRFPRARTAAFARRLGAYIEAGIAPPSALESARPPAKKTRVDTAVSGLRSGSSFTAALQDLRLFSPSAMGWIQAFERSGRLPEALERIADAIENDLAVAGDLVRRLLYPLFVLHLIPIAIGLPDLLLRGSYRSLLQVAWPLALAWALGGAAVWWIFFRTPSQSKSTAGLSIPGLGPVIRARAIQLYFDGMSALYGAGVGLVEAHQETCALLPHRGLRNMLAGADHLLNSGSSYRAALATTGALRSFELDHLETGERTGRLEDTLKQLGKLARTDAETRARRLVRLMAGCVYALAIILVAWTAISTYTGIYDQVRKEWQNTR